MATTRLIPMHVIKGQTVAHTVHDRLAYAMNPDKTEKGTLVSAFGCDSATVAAEMLLCKKQHEILIGRADEDRSDVLLYQIRQSFKPGEVTPELAQKIGYELAMRFTKGRHQFVVTTHVDHAHIHNHVIFNAASIDGTKKFRNFMGSSKAIRGISDRLCLENGLSIVEQPKIGHTHYGKWLGDKKKMSWQDLLRAAIDTALQIKPTNFDALLDAMKTAGYEVRSEAFLSFRAAGQKRFSRLAALGDGYSENDIRAIILGDKPHTPKAWALLRKNHGRINLLVEIQQKLQAGKGLGYERWAKVFNLKSMAQTINYLTEHRLTEYEILAERAKNITEQYQALFQQIKESEKRIAVNRKLQKHIVDYAATRIVYDAYQESGFSPIVYDKYSAEIVLHKSAKEAFDALPYKRIPSIMTLHAEYDELMVQKQKGRPQFVQARTIMREILAVKANVDRLLSEDTRIHRTMRFENKHRKERMMHQ